MNKIPDWLHCLRQQTQQHSLAEIGREIGYSKSTLSLVLAGTYSGNTQAVAAAVRRRYLQQSIPCPVLGEIPQRDCRQWASRAYSSASPLTVSMYRACRSGCRHNPAHTA